jgi:3-hydroxyisobutyrate dehydrogenase
MSKPSIGWVGLGAMGFGMATNLIKQGYSVTGFDVFPKTLERFTQAGGKAATSLAESAEGNMFYVCMVASAAQAQAALFDGVVKSISPSQSLPVLPADGTCLT